MTPVVISVGAQARVPVVDLDQRSRAVVQAAGVDGSKQLFLHLDAGVSPNYPAGIADDTHFQTLGARRMAELVKGDPAIGSLPIAPCVRP